MGLFKLFFLTLLCTFLAIVAMVVGYQGWAKSSDALTKKVNPEC